MKRKIFIITQYYPPEIGAPQNRLSELAVRLKRLDWEPIVITAMPNYPSMKIHKGYRSKIFSTEVIDGIKVYRSWIYVSKSKSLLLRLFNYFSFTISSFWLGLFVIKRKSIIFCESPPLFLGISTLMLSIFKNTKHLFNVSDLWPESAVKMGLVTSSTAIGVSTWLEELLYKKSDLITGQTQGIVENIKKRNPNKTVYWLPNGVDPSFYNPKDSVTTFRKSHSISEDKFVIGYAGILGYAQGLEVIIQSAKIIQNKHPDVLFVLVGNGPEKDKLESLVKELNLSNVRILEPVDKNEMPNVISGWNASVIPLKKLDLFKGAIPSKIFETLAMEKPIFLGVDGEAKELFINQGKAGYFFEPENHEDLTDKIIMACADKETFKTLGKNGRDYVLNHFNRDSIAEKLNEQLLSLI